MLLLFSTVLEILAQAEHSPGVSKPKSYYYNVMGQMARGQRGRQRSEVPNTEGP